MIFLDTSAVVALANTRDLRHAEAVACLDSLAGSGEMLLTHSYVLAESVALLQSRLGFAAAAAFARDSSEMEVVWVDGELHAEALERFLRTPRRRLSFVDQVSFAVMKRRGVRRAFAFDDDFRKAGFELLPAAAG